MAGFGSTGTDPVGGVGAYPFTKMNFVVSIAGSASGAAFSEISGFDATVDVIEFRQGNAGSLAPMKIPGLVKHGNLTMKFGITSASSFRQWIFDCISHTRGGAARADIIIELLDIRTEAIDTMAEDAVTTTSLAWTLKNAWVTKYTGTDLNALQSEVAIETIEVAYEYMDTIPQPTAAATGGGTGDGAAAGGETGGAAAPAAT